MSKKDQAICDSVSDDLLKTCFVGRWPVNKQQQSTKIPYMFSAKENYWANIFDNLDINFNSFDALENNFIDSEREKTFYNDHVLKWTPSFLESFVAYWIDLFEEVYKSNKHIRQLVDVDDQIKPIMEEKIRNTLKQYELHSNGAIQFVENKHPTPFSNGIHFYTLKPDALKEMNFFAVTELFYNNNGDIRNAWIFFPNDNQFWNSTLDFDRKNNNATITHEIGHAVGLHHLHNNAEIKNILSKSQNPGICSVMPYIGEVKPDYSFCKTKCSQSCDYLFDKQSDQICYSNCYGDFTSDPGPLDGRSLKMIYRDQVDVPSADNKARNIAREGIICSFISGSYYFLQHFTSNLKIDDKQLMSQTTANLISDAAMLATKIYLEYPLWDSLGYVLSASTKYLPEAVLNKMPTFVQSILTSNYSVQLANLSLAYLQSGKIPMTLMTNMLSNGVIGLLSGFVGAKLGDATASVVNYLQDKGPAIEYKKNPNVFFKPKSISSPDHDYTKSWVMDYGHL